MRHPRRPRHAFTFPELMIGLVVTSLVLTALAAVTTAVAQGWNAADGTQAVQLQSAQVYARTRAALAGAKYVAQVHAGSPDGSASPAGGVFYWAYDGWGGAADGGPQVGEMALIEHDPATQTLWLYQPIPVASMTASQVVRAATSLASTDLADPAWPANFKALDFVGPPTALGRYVSGATFALHSMDSTTETPVVEFTLAFTRGNQSSTQYGVAALHAPTTRPN